MLHLKVCELCVCSLSVSVFIMLKRIPVTKLHLGIYIHNFCGLWVGHSFWKASVLLKHQSELQRIIRSNISELWIDTDKGAASASLNRMSYPRRATQPLKHLRR